MSVQALVDTTKTTSAHPHVPRRPATGTHRSPSAAHILGLQRTAGNAAVARQLTQQQDKSVAKATSPGALAIQRCGPTPCDCSSDERADYAANNPDEQARAPENVQRTVAERVESVRGRGEGIEHDARLRLQRSFGTDLSPVRVHTDRGADTLSRNVGATAFTTGHDIFFRSGAYNPSSPSGFKTLAHEVTHVVQQSGGAVPGLDNGAGLSMSQEHDAGEQEADRTAERVLSEQGSPTGRGPQVQRLAQLGTPSARGAVQRLTDPLGPDLVVDWTTPGAAVALSDQTGSPIVGGAPLNFNGGDTANFTVPDRTASADLTFPVTAAWHGKGAPVPPGPVPPGPAPSQDCDACKVLLDGATAGTCTFIGEVVEDSIDVAAVALAARVLVQGACIPIVAAIGGTINLLPDSVLQACKSATIDEVINKLREIREESEKTSTVTDVIEVILKELKKIPVLGTLVNLATISLLIKAQISKRIGVLIEKLKELRDKCNKGGGSPTPAGGQGQATSTVRSKVFMQPDGQVKAVGPGAAQNISGTGATEESPVRFSQEGVPNGALVAQVPTIVAAGANGAKAGRQFTVNLNYGLPPAPQAINCPPAEFFPFQVAKDQFENELDAQTTIRDWFFGHDPEIRNTVHTGASTVKITGRASNTGSVEFNRQLAEKRAKRVEAIIRDFAGTDGKLRALSLGFLTAQEPGESGHERRAEAQIEGEVPADRVAAMKGGSACVGHNSESADEGPTGPQTSPLPELDGPGSETPTAAGVADSLFENVPTDFEF